MGVDRFTVPEADYWEMGTPSLADIARRFWNLRPSYPKLPIRGAKRDRDTALTMCRLRPDSRSFFGTEFEVGIRMGDNTPSSSWYCRFSLLALLEFSVG